MRFVAASYWHRDGEVVGECIALADHCAGSKKTCDAALAVEREARLAARAEEERCLGPCDCAGQGCHCSCCLPEVHSGRAWIHRADELFSAAELKEHRRSLMRGEVICLPR